MWRLLWRLLKGKRGQRWLSFKQYFKAYERYKQKYPKRIAQDQEKIQEWVTRVAETRRNKNNRQEKIAAAIEPRETEREKMLRQTRETVRTAFMRHPAATEADFRRCWPSIREELLKRHTLDDLAANPSAIQMFSLTNTAGESQANLDLTEHSDEIG
jgi:vacuolar-type H+-ATPase catalytic subunit A/Vma1